MNEELIIEKLDDIREVLKNIQVQLLNIEDRMPQPTISVIAHDR